MVSMSRWFVGSSAAHVASSRVGNEWYVRIEGTDRRHPEFPTAYLATACWDGSLLSLQSRPGSSSHPKGAAQHDISNVRSKVAQQGSSQQRCRYQLHTLILRVWAAPVMPKRPTTDRILSCIHVQQHE